MNTIKQLIALQIAIAEICEAIGAMHVSVASYENDPNCKAANAIEKQCVEITKSAIVSYTEKSEDHEYLGQFLKQLRKLQNDIIALGGMLASMCTNDPNCKTIDDIEKQCSDIVDVVVEKHKEASHANEIKSLKEQLEHVNEIKSLKEQLEHADEINERQAAEINSLKEQLAKANSRNMSVGRVEQHFSSIINLQNAELDAMEERLTEANEAIEQLKKDKANTQASIIEYIKSM